MYASSRGYTRACKILLRRGADPNLQAIDGATAGIFASYSGNSKIVKLLLEKGLDPNLQALDGSSALMIGFPERTNGGCKIIA